MAAFPTCVLHVGFEKTGSTSIQAFLTEHVERLQRLGHFVPRSLARGDGFCNHVRLPAHALADDKLDDDVRVHFGLASHDQLAAFRGATRRLLASEIRTRGGGGTMLLSNEHLSSRLDQDDELERLRDLLGGFCDEFRIIAYLRNQVDVLESLYGEAIKGGHCDISLIPDFSADAGDPWIGQDYFEYGRTLRRWVRVFGRDSVEVRLFDRTTLRSGDVVADFLGCLGIDPSRFAALPRANERLDARAQAFLLRINRALRPLPPDEANRIRDVVTGLLAAMPQGPSLQLSEPEAQDFMALFRDENEWVRERWFPSSATLFPPGRARERSRPADAEASLADTVELTTLLLRKLIPGA